MNHNQQQKGNLPLVILIIVLGLTVLGAGGYYVYSRNNNEAGSGSEVASLTSAEPTVESEELITTTVTTLLDDGGSLKVTHPKSWTVSQESKDYLDGLKLRKSYIKSEQGNYLHIYELDGIGGGCDPDNQVFTLDHRVETAIPGVVFSEYSYDTQQRKALELEDYNTGPVSAAKDMKEGDSLTDLCTNLSGYPDITFDKDKGVELFVSLSRDAERTGGLTYDELSSDPELMKAVRTLSK